MRRYIREPFNGLSHAAGACLALAGLVWLLVEAHAPDKVAPWWPLAVFGGTMILLFVSSTLYHSLPVSPRIVAHLRRVDHMMIYIFIAGTYTPLCVLALGGNLGLALVVVAWVLAAAGVLMKLVWMHAPRWLYVVTYLGMGWMGVLVLPRLVDTFSAPALAWLVAGGVFYTGGTIVYAARRPNPIPGWFGFHEIWHLCVMGGTFSHFWLIRTYVAA